MSIIERVKAFIESTLQGIDSSFADVRPLTQLCNLLKIRPAFIVLILLMIAVLSLGTGICSHMLVAVVGTMYPAYQTYRVSDNSFRLFRQTTLRGARSG